MDIKTRITTGWTLQRFAFLAIGLWLGISAAMEQQWGGVLFGSYFAAMGLFALGCASGNCGVAAPRENTLKDETVTYEELK